MIAVGQFFGQRADAVPIAPQYPSFAQIAGHALSSIFLDNLGADLERLTQMNRPLELLPAARLERSGLMLRHADAMVLAPSIDLGPLALHYADRLPPACERCSAASQHARQRRQSVVVPVVRPRLLPGAAAARIPGHLCAAR